MNRLPLPRNTLCFKITFPSFRFAVLVSQYSDCVLSAVLFSASEQLELLLELTKIMILLCHIQAAIGKLLETWMRKVMTFLKELLVYLLKETFFKLFKPVSLWSSLFPV